MKIGLIDVDGHNYPNLPLMKLSAWHKQQGDDIGWYDLMQATTHYMLTGENLYDKVYMSKVFSFTHDYDEFVYADEIEKGGSGYCIQSIDGKEIYDKTKDNSLPYEIEHIYPDYSIYSDIVQDTAYGFLTRGCPRGCDFCHVKDKEGRCSVKVADLSEFWRGQKNIVICDPNLIACKDWKELLQQLIDSKAWVDINQGVDIRMMTEEKAKMLKQIKIKQIHFAWDRYEDKEWIVPKLKLFKEITEWKHQKMSVYVLTNFNTTFEQDLERVYTLRDLGYTPYVMIYEKHKLDESNKVRKLQRWVNSKMAFYACEKFEDYKR